MTEVQDSSRRSHAVLVPHPPLAAFYGAGTPREDFVRGIFDLTCGSYNRINALASLGSGAWYRRRALLRAGLRPGHRLLDVAVGTGLVAREAVRILGTGADVLGLDLSEGMLAEARRQLGGAVPLVRARAEALPLRGASVDFVTMGYALRHVADLAATFAEYRRVLRPGGRLLVLEIARPEGRVARASARFYLGRLVPLLARIAGGGRAAATLMRYYWDTIETCVPPATIERAMGEAGLSAVASEVQFGILRAYTATGWGGTAAA
jgi:demethylmenaquinone methyltransferase/2-methoxy-6-polyprenyl-1,4-benzoquinol methylase